MYIDHIALKDFRTFKSAKISFVHPDADFKELGLPTPRLPNINLLLGNNGLGKTSLLRGIAAAALGPAVRSSGLYAYRLVRRGPEHRRKKMPRGARQAVIDALFTMHRQDQTRVGSNLKSKVRVMRRTDLEEWRWGRRDESRWRPIYSAESEAFFFVGYGATRRVEKKEQENLGSRKSTAFVRAQRVRGLFEDSHSLIPLNVWLPSQNKGRFTQVVNLINDAMGPGHFEFRGEMESDEYIFRKQGLRVPFPALSDGYRAFVGWLGDLLYHICTTCPSGKKLTENRGIVMVDEIDLHLHPKWQLSVLPTLAQVFPNIQFIVTSHSPLIVGSLEWMNIILMQEGADQSSAPRRIRLAVHGLDSDQVLVTEFFGMESTRADPKQRALKDLTLKAREGDTKAATRLLHEMSRGVEAT